ncbi:Holliday junction DNA helicase RuvA [Sedimentibacter acidaminivorans]|uniref:Holliday junction branch migration complex subunit RuvA n=1 Tax=Sedimentibacter acidaminivorans TaxID=913099 RepID=A0ABS4GBG9_9FIRM|nr:Holliday junction branch migration protein RuvA [Sedimentibacter acidaminivorans]MBP1925022.1 Holliday junction DNA helicase RuvA [Sedimentibacter acidaminivorans]
MISFIKGEIVKKGLDYLIVENNGIGYFINTSFSTLNMVKEGEKLLIYTYMHVREDILSLFGFLKQEEIDMFKKLISVSGVGPKAGLSILSTYDTNTIKAIILKDDSTKMSKVPGIGKKTASKIILELKDKVGTIESLDKDDYLLDEYVSTTSSDKESSSDVINALVALGFTQFEAKKALENIDIKGKSENEIIMELLKNINS